MIKADDFKWLDRVYHLFHLGSYLCLSGALTDCFLPFGISPVNYSDSGKNERIIGDSSRYFFPRSLTSTYHFRMANRALSRCAANVSRHLQRRALVSSVRLSSNCITKQHTPVLHSNLQTQQTRARMLCTKASTDFIVNIQDEEDFEQKVMKSSVPVVVDFHAG